MTQEEILDYNRRCAEFLDWKFSQHYEHYDEFYYEWEEENSGVWYKVEDFVEDTDSTYVKVEGRGLKNYHYRLKFHDDWNWIMEVVEAIEKLPEHYTTAIHSDTFDKGDEYKMFIFNNEGEILVGENGKTKKEAVVNTINQFLIWYNENKS